MKTLAYTRFERKEESQVEVPQEPGAASIHYLCGDRVGSTFLFETRTTTTMNDETLQRIRDRVKEYNLSEQEVQTIDTARRQVLTYRTIHSTLSTSHCNTHC